MPERTPEEIAKALSSSQAELLIAIFRWPEDGDGFHLCTIDVDGRPRRALERKGLLEREFEMPLTDLGRAVAALLAQPAPSETEADPC